jgi:preprotein translocase subunit SecE
VSNVSDSHAAQKGRQSDAGKSGDHRTGPLTFYRQVVAELRKVVYPTREQLVTYFFVVMIFVLVMITVVSLLDLGLGKAVFAIFTGADDV